MDSNDFRELEKSLYKAGDRKYEGAVKFAVGAKIPFEKYAGAFARVAFDLWQIEPNIAINEDFWRLDDDKKFFVKVYEDGEATPHDKRWSVFPTSDKSQVSVAYKNDPLVTLDVNTLGFGPENIVAAQKSLLKLLSSQDGRASILGSVDDNIRDSFVGRYPELGV